MQPKKNGSSKQSGQKKFHLEFKTTAQKMAWAAFQQHDVLFLNGVAGSGKTHIAMAFAINEVLQGNKKRIILTRPIVEAGESLGYLPGDFNEKVNPYMLPMTDCLNKLVGTAGPQRELLNQSIEVAPLAYMRGRAEDVDTLIPTPEGSQRMGDLKVGDMVFGSNGEPTKVIGVYPQGVKKMYRVNFNDGTSARCSEDHLWDTMTLNEKRHGKGFTTKSTSEIAKKVTNKWNQKFHRVPISSGPAMFESQSVDVDPYLLGLLLGDGHMRQGSVKIATADRFIVEEIEKIISPSMKVMFRKNYDYSLVSNPAQSRKNNLLSSLSELGLLGRKSYNKFIPVEYLNNDVKTRLEILRGLLDTDGWVCEHRSGTTRVQYCSTSKRLAEDVMYLVRSLGGMSYKRMRKIDSNRISMCNGRPMKSVHDCYIVDISMPQFNPFKLPRKADRWKPQNTLRMISSIVEDGSAECQCIQVSAKDHLYLTNDFVVTHNTFDDAVCIFDESQNATLGQLRLFLSRFGENSKIIVTGDPSQSDIGNRSGLSEVLLKLADMPGIGQVTFGPADIVRHKLISGILERLGSSGC